jgi:hypothetical protein
MMNESQWMRNDNIKNPVRTKRWYYNVDDEGDEDVGDNGVICRSSPVDVCRFGAAPSVETKSKTAIGAGVLGRVARGVGG